MIGKEELKNKKKEINAIIDLCTKKQLCDYEFNSTEICIITLIIVIAFSVALNFIDVLSVTSVCVIIALSGGALKLFIHPYISKFIKNTDERLYTRVYIYESPFSDKKGYREMVETLKENKCYGSDHIIIKEWARLELDEINSIIYNQTKEGEIRTMILEKRIDK